MINYRCTKYLGTNNGSLVNYVVASLLSFILLLVTSRLSIDVYSFGQAPWWLYLGGAFGIIAFIISMITLSHLKVMESTILLLTGQLTAGILFDALVFHDFSLKKLTGILLVAVGIVWDNKISSLDKEKSPK